MMQATAILSKNTTHMEHEPTLSTYLCPYARVLHAIQLLSRLDLVN